MIEKQIQSNESKPCNNCGAYKTLDEFYRSKTGKLGRDGVCKKCRSAYQKKHHKDNSERDNAKARAWYQNNKKRHLENSASWYAANRERKLLTSKIWWQNHPELQREKINRRRARLNHNAEKISYKNIWQSSDRICYLCAEPIPSIRDCHFDHIMPISQGGLHIASNIAPTHPKCNLKKSDKVIKEIIKMPLPDNTNDSNKINPVNEIGNVYYSILSISGTRVPEGAIEDFFSQGDIQYGKENVDAFNRYIKWVQQSPGVWMVSLGPSNKQGIG